MTRLRRSAAVLVDRGAGEEVVLVERSSDLAFFGGFWAAPGGVLDESDAREGESLGDEVTLRRCALRELFEETGITPAGLALGGESERSELRRDLIAGGGRKRWNDCLDAAPAAMDELQFVCQLTTPPFAARRYQTSFYRLTVPPSTACVIWSGELTDGQFSNPTDALASWRQGELRLVAPVLSLLEMWCAARAAADFPAGFFAAADRAAEGLRNDVPRLARNSPGVGCLPLATPTLPPATTTNCYVVGSQHLYIVDPATYEASERERLYGVLDRAREDGASIAGVIATHHHADHVGSVNEVAARYRVPVYGHERTLERLPAAPEVAKVLADGDRIPLGHSPDGADGWHLEVMYTPGHDRGHLVFRDSRYGSLIAGDLVSTLSTIVIDPPEGHLATYLQTLERVRDRGVGMIFPAHGPPHPDGLRLIETYLRHRQRRESKLLDALGPDARSLEALLAEVYDDVDKRMRGVARRSLAAGLEKLVEEGRACEVAGGWSLDSRSRRA